MLGQVRQEYRLFADLNTGGMVVDLKGLTGFFEHTLSVSDVFARSGSILGSINNSFTGHSVSGENHRLISAHFFSRGFKCMYEGSRHLDEIFALFSATINLGPFWGPGEDCRDVYTFKCNSSSFKHLQCIYIRYNQL